MEIFDFLLYLCYNIYRKSREGIMWFKTLGSDRVLHEGAGYRSKYFQKCELKLEKPNEPIYIPTTMKWASKK